MKPHQKAGYEGAGEPSPAETEESQTHDNALCDRRRRQR